MEGRRTWYHTIDLPDGPTPGYFDTRAAPDGVPWPAQLKGGRCLDVGTFDGFWAFEMERRGAAEVVACDLDDPRQLDWSFDDEEAGPAAIEAWGSERGPGFARAAAALGSRVRRVARSAYDLDPDQDGAFDVVFCGSLLLHLRDPVRALSAMRSVCRGVLVLVEAVDPRLEVVARRIPAARLRPERDEWWRVNSAGLCQLAVTAGFRVIQVGPRLSIPLGPGAAAGHRLPLLSGVLTGKPGRRGLLVRSVVAEPRPRQPAS